MSDLLLRVGSKIISYLFHPMLTGKSNANYVHSIFHM